MTEQPKKIDLGAVFDEMTRDEASDVIAELLGGDMHLWMNLAQSFPHAPTALIELVKKAEARFLRIIRPPTDEEKMLFTFGALPPSQRVMEIALFIANDPESLKTFKELTAPIVESREKSAVEMLALQYGARGKKAVDN